MYVFVYAGYGIIIRTNMMAFLYFSFNGMSTAEKVLQTNWEGESEAENINASVNHFSLKRKIILIFLQSV
jgi:hypothetical protein